MQKPSYTPYVFHTVKALPQLTEAQRRQRLAEVGYNVIHLMPHEIAFDLYTDSGTAAESDVQLSRRLLGDRGPEGLGQSGQRLHQLLTEVFGYPFHCTYTQGRSADMGFSKALAKPGTLIPGNMTFMTAQYHQAMVGAKPVSVICEEAFDLNSDFVFKGNVDLARLEAVLKDENNTVSFVNIELCVNAVGGYPISMANLKEVARLTHEHQLLLILDATRILENAQFIKLYEEGYADRSIAEIVREICEYADASVLSLKKDFLTHTGGAIGVRSKDLYLQLRDGVMMSGSEIPGPEMEVIAQGIREAVLNDAHMEHRLRQTKRLFDGLKGYGVPVVEPYGGHGVWVDLREFLKAVPADQFPTTSLLNQLYVTGNLRGNLTSIHLSDGTNVPAMRLTLPHRLFDDSHLDFMAAAIGEVWNNREQLRGYELVHKDPGMLGPYLATYKPVEA